MSVLQKEKFSCACRVRGRRAVGEAGSLRALAPAPKLHLHHQAGSSRSMCRGRIREKWKLSRWLQSCHADHSPLDHLVAVAKS